MCLSIPSKVVAIDETTNSVTVDTMGVLRSASLDLMEAGSVKIGDFVLLHIGFVMNTIDEADALESLRVYNEILSIMDEDARRAAIIDDDNCENRG
ncbi:MAG: hydrogenase assembly protein HypC [Sulfuricurvum sp. PC08-66]|nr:MAG: hydrogenase assembly protein HypC [Sulfuricurvum sp. PC08-66]